MRASTSNRRDFAESDRIGREIMRKIGSMDPYANADPYEVEARLRNMNYGATNSRLSKLRRGADAKPDTIVEQPEHLERAATR